MLMIKLDSARNGSCFVINKQRPSVFHLSLTFWSQGFSGSAQDLCRCFLQPQELSRNGCCQHVGVSENVVYILNLMVLLIIIPSWKMAINFIGNINPTFSVTKPCNNLMSPPALEVYGIRGILDDLPLSQAKTFAKELISSHSWYGFIAQDWHYSVYVVWHAWHVHNVLPDYTSNIHEIEKTLGSFPTFSQK